MISAPVRFGPQRYGPPPGADASCASKNEKCVLKFESRKPDWILPATARVMGLRKKGTGEFLISGILVREWGVGWRVESGKLT